MFAGAAWFSPRPTRRQGEWCHRVLVRSICRGSPARFSTGTRAVGPPCCLRPVRFPLARLGADGSVFTRSCKASIPPRDHRAAALASRKSRSRGDVAYNTKERKAFGRPLAHSRASFRSPRPRRISTPRACSATGAVARGVGEPTPRVGDVSCGDRSRRETIHQCRSPRALRLHRRAAVRAAHARASGRAATAPRRS